MIWFLVGIPFFAGLLAYLIRSDRLRRGLLVTVALTHMALCLAAWQHLPQTAMHGWLAIGALEILFLSITSLLFLAASVYALGYLSREGHGAHRDNQEGYLFNNAPETVFTACLLLFLAMMTLVIVSNHFGIMWVAIEATTLASAPLIYFHRHHRSLESTWKYLLICSVGIAIALLGNFFLVVAAHDLPHDSAAMTVQGLTRNAALLNIPWLKAAFILLLVGYGTKMGLAPLHTWLPDAHSEAPSLVSALLSGALLNCAFLAILRAHSVCVAAGLIAFSSELLILLGLLSMAFAAVFIFRQADYKRMLAYSSVEHMGILAFGIGIGGAAGFGALLHAVNHSLTKALLFLVSGNILAFYKTKSSIEVRGLMRALPFSGILWMAGFLALSGSPPFGAFISEFKVLQGAIDQQKYLEAGLFVLFLLIVFIGMADIVLRMAHGPVPEALTGKYENSPARETWTAIAPPATLALAILVLGLYVPTWLSRTITEALSTVMP